MHVNMFDDVRESHIAVNELAFKLLRYGELDILFDFLFLNHNFNSSSSTCYF